MLRLRARVKVPVVRTHTVTGEKIQEDAVGVLIVKVEKSTILGTKVFWDTLLDDGVVIKEVPTELVTEFPWSKNEKSVVSDDGDTTEEVVKEPEPENVG